MIDDRENVLLVFLRFENQGQDNSQEYKEGAKPETNIICTRFGLSSAYSVIPNATRAISRKILFINN